MDSPTNSKACRNIPFPKKKIKGESGFILGLYQLCRSLFLLALSWPSCPLRRRFIFSRCLYTSKNDNKRNRKNTGQTGDSLFTQGISRKSQGRAVSIVIPERLEICFQKNITNHKIAAQMQMFKCKTANTPNNVEIPFPPLKRKNTEKTCPQTTITPARLKKIF